MAIQIIKKTVDLLGMPIYGDLKNGDNIKLLKQSLEEEKRFNDPTIAIRPLGEKYKLNKELYGQSLYEYEKDLTFIDVDVFRQPALTFKETGSYCPFDSKYNKLAYKHYWDIVEYRRRHGMTAWAGLDLDCKPRLVHITGKHYGFLNFGPINKVKDDDNAISNENEFKSVPNDDNLSLMKLEELVKELNIRDKRTAKKEVDFPEFFDAQYHLIVHKYFCRLLGHNCWFGKARRKGMSYYNSFDLFDDIDMNPDVAVILAAHDKKYLTQGKGLMRMLFTYSDWINKFTDFKKRRLVENKEHLKFGYTKSGSKVEYGYRSEALAVSAKNNADVTIGKDAFQLAYEEMGKFPNWSESYSVTTSTAEAGDYTTGHICGWGTGGTEDADWEDFFKVCYNPTAYDGIACNNIWDPGKLGTACAYFYAHVHGLEGNMDYNGNTNFDAAWKSFLKKKEIKRATLSDETEFEKWCSQRANSPMEAFARSGSNIFPREAILAQLHTVETDPTIKFLSREGELYKDSDGIIKLKTNDEKRADGSTSIHSPVNDFPLTKDTDVFGCFVQWIAPYRDYRTGKIPKDLYVAIQDPYAHDKDRKNLKLKDSLGATYFYENVNNITPYGGGIPVAAYVGRPDTMNYYNEQVMYGLEMYNAKLMFENDRGDTKSFMESRKKLHYLFEEPELDFVKEVQGKTGRGFGMHMTDRRIAKGAIYLRDKLNEVVRKTNGVEKTFLNYIFDPGLLKELLKWEPNGNFDRVSAWLIGMYIMKEMEFQEIKPPAPHKNNSIFNRKFY